MSSNVLLVLFAIGAAADALWLDFRFPSLAPTDLKYGILHLATASLFAHTAVPLAMQYTGDSKGVVLAAVFGVGFPALTYIFLSGLWMLKLCQGMLAGHLR